MTKDFDLKTTNSFMNLQQKSQTYALLLWMLPIFPVCIFRKLKQLPGRQPTAKKII
jgi:hypothetical protein